MQCSFRTLVFIYIFGGLTFVPLVAVAVLAFIYYTSPVVEPVSSADAVRADEKHATPASQSSEEIKDDDDLEGPDAHKVGWLQVSRKYDPRIGLIGPDKIPGNQKGKYIDKMRSLLDRQEPYGSHNAEFLKVKAAMFYAVLKHGNLFLYESEEQLDVKHVIVLQHFITSLWPLSTDDSTLFIKANAICLSRKDLGNGIVKTTIDNEGGDSKETHKTKPPEHSYFLFPTTNVEKEDWYFALLRGSKSTTNSTKTPSPIDPTVAAVTARFEPAHMFSLIQAIHSSDAQLQTRWLNALVGRIFLGIYQTKFLEEFFIKKITKKIARVNRPSFLSDIKVQKVVVGSQAPVFTQPRLKELSAAGEFTADVNLTYNGGFRIEIATVATLQLGSRFKPRQVSLSMAVTVKRMEGKLLVRIKRPPSNRIWFGFYEAPNMDLTIEPIVSSRQITYTMILRAIENRIRDAIEESIVLPNMDDIAFLQTVGEFYRGGIWKRKDDEPKPDPNDPAASGDVDAVEKELEKEAIGDDDVKDDSMENSESTESVVNAESKQRTKTTLRAPGKDATSPENISEQNLKTRVARSQSFTSVASAPAIVATDLINVTGTSPSRDNTDWSAEAAARAVAQKARMTESPNPGADTPSDVTGSLPMSLKSDSSPEEVTQAQEKNLKDAEAPPSPLKDSLASTPPDSDHAATPPIEPQNTPPREHVRRSSAFSLDRDAPLSSRVSQATEAAKEMIKTRFNTYLAKRQQSRLEKQLLNKDRDLLINSTKPRTQLPSESLPNFAQKPEDEDIDSGPLPYENKRPPAFSPGEFSTQSPGYGPSATMEVPSTMTSARTPSTVTETPTPSTPPALPPRSLAVKRPVPPPPLPPRSAPRPIPRRPVPKPPPIGHNSDSGPQTPSGSLERKESPTRQNHSIDDDNDDDDDDLMILHIPSDEEDTESAISSEKEPESSPIDIPKGRHRVLPEEREAVMESPPYGSSKGHRLSAANESAPQWNEKHTSDRKLPEMMEQGLMG